MDPIIISADVALDKPGEEIFQYALKCAGVAAQNTVFVDDTLGNIETALRLGMQAIHYKPGMLIEAKLREYEVSLD